MHSKGYLFSFGVLLFMAIAFDASAQNLQRYLDQYFAGAAIKFGYGAGTSSNNPRVELMVHYCASGNYRSAGQSCRPNVIARGHQCTPVRDAGQWRVVARGQQIRLYWQPNGGRVSSLPLKINRSGTVVDVRGNQFVRAGRAQCR